MRILYHVMSAPAPLGLLFLATSERGLRYVEFMDKRSLKRTIAAHAADNPGAVWEPSVRELRPLAEQLEQYFCGTAQRMSVPVDPAGSEFQLKVWRALLDIPYGETRSYGEIARTIGDPKAARAVGLAVNQNPIVIMVPCHRVIGADGKLVGYNGGVLRKKFLLTLESRFKGMLPLEGDRVIAEVTVQVKKKAVPARPARASKPTRTSRPKRAVAAAAPTRSESPARTPAAAPSAVRSKRKLVASPPTRRTR